jgi:glycosyltransferase involved in cell wall biosynthesis
VIPNGIDTDRFRPNSESQCEWRRKFGIPQTGFLIGTAARLVPVKNHVGVFQAIARLRAKGVQARFVLAGDGPLRDELQQVVRDLGIAEQVHFLGDIHNVPEFLNSLDVFVLFSHSEGMSITILESMACGLPVVVTSVGSNPMLVADGDSGYVVPSGDVESLVNALAVLAEDPRKRQAMGLAGRKRIEDSYSVDRMVQIYSDLYDTLGTKQLHSTTPVVSCRSGESE